MIKEIKKIAVTSNSYPFMSAKPHCDFEKYGYTEEEYFFSGTANIYKKGDDDAPEVIYEDAPYTNRFIVRRPKNLKNVSGRVVVEIINSSSFMDIDRVWVLVHNGFMRNGDVYVGITSKPITMKTLKKFNPERYSELSWDNPLPCFLQADALGNFPGASNPKTEDGLFWDMLTDIGLEIRETPEILGGIKADKVYLTGWSQSGSYMVLYTNMFAKQRYDRGLSPVFDGYFSAGPGPVVVPCLNQGECMDISSGYATIKFSNVPYFTLHTESENAYLGTYETRIPNSDSEDLKYRIYEIPGATHDSVYSMLKYYKDSSDMAKTGIYLPYPGKEPNPNDFPYYLAYRAGFQCFYDWVEKDIIPPEIESITVNDDLSNKKDEFGNAINGWRLPEIEYPVCSYKQKATPLRPMDSTMLYGCEMPFSPERLRELYIDIDNYRKLIEKDTDKAIQKRLLLEEDKQECIDHAVEKAYKYGLR